ncbi:MAG: ubiquinol-cytochrome c reductase iron-sulfur subunit [Burkholderiales bacterium]|nr:MAG: ubiquinol-cytochrome c reductase iron-sulfur subunit [Burkholderiales bacterium]
MSNVDSSKRTWIIASACAGVPAAGLVAVPFVSTFSPSEKAKAAGAAIEVDISDIKPGEKVVREWRGKPVWIMRRTPEQIASLTKTESSLADPKSERKAAEVTPMPETRNTHRSIKPEIFVAVGICSHLGCSPSDKLEAKAESFDANWQGGFICPCHGSTFDMAGRVYKNKPAPDNLEVPPHMYISDTKLLIGETKQA